MSFDEVNIWKVGGEALPESCLPLGMKPEDHRTKVVPVPPTPALQVPSPLSSSLIRCAACEVGLENHVVGVSFAEPSEEKLATTNVAGFVVVLGVEAEGRTLTLLSPQPHPLPSASLSFSHLTYEDD